MRIVLIERGGFVGVPVCYTVDLAALHPAVLTALERAIAAQAAADAPLPQTSAGGLRIRLERDDGSVGELSLAHAAPSASPADLADQLRACATPLRER